LLCHILGELNEFLVFGHRGRLATQFNHGANGRIEIGVDREPAFGRFPILTDCLGLNALLPQRFNGGFFVSLRFLKCSLAVHHRQARTIAQ
jgi:hypothetical protein